MYQSTLNVEVPSETIMSVYPKEVLLDHFVTYHCSNGLKFGTSVLHHMPSDVCIVPRPYGLNFQNLNAKTQN